MANPILEQAKENMEKAEASLRRTLGQIRAGRANASLVNRVNVEYYGAMTPLNQIAAITIFHLVSPSAITKWALVTEAVLLLALRLFKRLFRNVSAS